MDIAIAKCAADFRSNPTICRSRRRALGTLKKHGLDENATDAVNTEILRQNRISIKRKELRKRNCITINERLWQIKWRKAEEAKRIPQIR